MVEVATMVAAAMEVVFQVSESHRVGNSWLRAESLRLDNPSNNYIFHCMYQGSHYRYHMFHTNHLNNCRQRQHLGSQVIEQKYHSIHNLTHLRRDKQVG